MSRLAFGKAVFALVALATLALVGCGGDDDADDGSDGGTDTDPDTDSDADTDSECDTDPACEGCLVEFADPNLEQAVREWSADPEYEGPLCAGDVDWIEGVEASGYDIYDLDGMQALVSLQWFNLFSDHVSDLSPLVGLFALNELWLTHNNVSDLTPLVMNEGLAAGDTIDLNDNPIDSDAQAANIEALCDRGVSLDPYCP